MRTLIALAACVVLAACSSSTGSDMTMIEARDQVRTVLTDLAVELDGPITVLDEGIQPAAATQAEGDEEMQYHLSLDVAVDPPRVRQVVEDVLADRYEQQGWNVEVDPWDDMPLRLTKDGALLAITAGPDRDGALVRGTSAVVPTPEDVRPITAKLPFEAYTPPS